MGIKDIFSRSGQKAVHEDGSTIPSTAEPIETVDSTVEGQSCNIAADTVVTSNEQVVPLTQEVVEDAASEVEEEGQTLSKETTSSRNIPQFRSPLELLSQTLPARAGIIDMRLRSNLVGTIEVVLREGGERFVYDWSGEQFNFKQIPQSAVAPSSDCTINIGSAHLMKIASGDLNPQIAMLSDKIQLEGKAGLGIYFFNLVAPRGR